MMSAKAKHFNGFQFFLILVYVVSILALIYYVSRGWDYYLTEINERPRHEDYQFLKPGGNLGHGFGIVGSAMMVIMFLYSVRKRTRFLSKIGTLAHWLDMHIYLGIFGPLFIILHSTLKVNGLVAVSFYSMVAVALSGVLGRYLYLQIPRNIQGHELSLDELKKNDEKLTLALKKNFQFTDSMIDNVEHLTTVSGVNSGNTIIFLFSLLVDDIRRQRAFKKFTKHHPLARRLKKHQIRAMLALARQKAILHHRIQILNRVNQLFHYWHVIHKPFAIIMIIIMFVHITVAIMFGYKWIF